MKKVLVYVSCVLVFFSLLPGQTAAKQSGNTLIMYQGSEEEVRKVDMLVGHFSDQITVMPAEEVSDLEEYSDIVYVGMDEGEPSGKVTALLDEYQGPVFFIGQHLDQFARNDFLTFKQNESLISVVEDGRVTPLSVNKLAFSYETSDEAEVLYEGKTADHAFPLIFRRDEDYFAAVESVNGKLRDFVGEALFSFYGQEKGESVKALRLEDVHPKTEPKNLRQIAEYLASEKIPYMVTVIPVYTNPETGEEIHLADEKELVRTLKYMQEHGASIVLHGYKHQYRDAETGEGFEYWDVENERPIYQGKDEEARVRADFASEEEYQQFVLEGQAFEKKYIERTVAQGVQELAEQGLYPLAFEAPHYAMSVAGYQELSKYFSTYIGVLQISDNTYKASFAPIYDSTPAYLHGMRLIPETLGYVDPEDKDVLQKIDQQAAYLTGFSDSYLQAFYHPYLGLDNLKELVGIFKKYDTLAWFDLKQQTNHVTAGGIELSSENGKITTNIPWQHYLKKYWWISLPILLVLIIGLAAKWNQRRE